MNAYKAAPHGLGKENTEPKHTNDCGDILTCCYLPEGASYNTECCHKEIELSVACEEPVKPTSNCLRVSREGMCSCWEVCYAHAENMLSFVTLDTSTGYVTEPPNNSKSVG